MGWSHRQHVSAASGEEGGITLCHHHCYPCCCQVLCPAGLQPHALPLEKKLHCHHHPHFCSPVPHAALLAQTSAGGRGRGGTFPSMPPQYITNGWGPLFRTSIVSSPVWTGKHKRFTSISSASSNSTPQCSANYPEASVSSNSARRGCASSTATRQERV